MLVFSFQLNLKPIMSTKTEF